MANGDDSCGFAHRVVSTLMRLVPGGAVVQAEKAVTSLSTTRKPEQPASKAPMKVTEKITFIRRLISVFLDDFATPIAIESLTWEA